MCVCVYTDVTALTTQSGESGGGASFSSPIPWRLRWILQRDEELELVYTLTGLARMGKGLAWTLT